LDDGRSYWGWAASSALHGILLALILLGFASAPKFEDSPESIPVETVSISELNQIMNGEKDAKPAPQPPQPAPPQAAPAPPTPPEPPPDLRTSEEPAPSPPPRPEAPPPPKPQPPTPQKPSPPTPPKLALAEDAPEPPVRPKTIETPPERARETQPEKPKPDQIAKVVERERTEAAPKPTHAYDPNAIAKLIQSRPSASQAPSNAASATPQGLPHHDAPRMSLSLSSALDAWLTESYLNCWTPPPAMPEGDVYVAEIKVVFNADGSLSARPVLLNPPTDPAWRAHAESAMRAVKKCDPLHVPPEYAPYFNEWKVETIHFDPRDTQG